MLFKLRQLIIFSGSVFATRWVFGAVVRRGGRRPLEASRIWVFGARYAIGMLQVFARRGAISIAWSGEARRRLSWMQWARRALIFVGTILAIPQLQKGFRFGIHEAWLSLFPSHVLVLL